MAPHDAESRMDREFRLHIEMEAERLIRERGLTPEEAWRQARVAFGGVEGHKEAMRDGRGLAWLDRFSLDLKLAVRLLARYPMLTLVATASLAFGVAAGVGAFEIRRQMVSPSIPLDRGDRIVGLRNWDTERVGPVAPRADDVAAWRDSLTLVADVSAARTFERNLITDDGRSETVSVAAITASAFRVARTLPLLGRALVEADERPGAPPVIVIGHDVWRQRFAGDSAAVGRTVRLGRDPMTIVGVMPEGFVFPATHTAWVPMRVERTVVAATDTAGLLAFARLADGASMEQAQAELTVFARRAAARSGQPRDQLRPQLVPFGWLYFDPAGVRIGLGLFNGFVVILLIVICANVALLMFARSATREGEIAVRSALGAGRWRIVAQLFIEALVLAALAAGVGLAVAKAALGSLLAMIEINSGRPLPFWVGDRLSPSMVLYAFGLAALGAAIIGVVPALRITGRGVQSRLRESAAGAGGIRFGGVWTGVIAAQVAVTLMFPAAAFVFHRWAVAGQTRDVGFPSDQYLSARVSVDGDRGAAYAELQRRLMAEPEVTGVTFTDRLPGTPHPRWRIEFDGGAGSGAESRHDIVAASVALDYFNVLGTPVLAGRGFTSADLESSRRVAVVNQSFVTRVLRGRNPVGRRLRHVPLNASSMPGPWLEIVGVVRDLGMIGGEDDRIAAGLYQPLLPDAAPTVRVAVHTRVVPESMAARLRTVAAHVDPGLQVHDLMRLDAAGASGWVESQYMSWVSTALSVTALLLSLTAIYSVVAYTVSRRTREIGIRVTLGADRRRVMAVVLRRPLTQVGLGVVGGVVLVTLFFVAVYQSAPTVTEALMIAGYAIVMMGVCLLACVVPTRRALAVAPADVLRS